MVMKKDLTPLRKGGQIDKRQGKGGKVTSPRELANPDAPFGSYAKATPMAQPGGGQEMIPPELMQLLMGGGR